MNAFSSYQWREITIPDMPYDPKYAACYEWARIVDGYIIWQEWNTTGMWGTYRDHGEPTHYRSLTNDCVPVPLDQRRAPEKPICA